MRHQRLMGPVIATEFGQIEGEFLSREEQFGITGQAGVDRIAPAMDDPCTGKRAMDEPCKQAVERHFVDDARDALRRRPQPVQIVAANVAKILDIGCRESGMPGGIAPPRASPPGPCAAIRRRRECEGAMPRICSTRDVPDRGIPITKIGKSELRPDARCKFRRRECSDGFGKSARIGVRIVADETALDAVSNPQMMKRPFARVTLEPGIAQDEMQMHAVGVRWRCGIRETVDRIEFSVRPTDRIPATPPTYRGCWWIRLQCACAFHRHGRLFASSHSH